MSAITDVVGLVLELEERVSDRKLLDMLLPIKQKIHETEKENFELEKSQFHQENNLSLSLNLNLSLSLQLELLAS